MDNGFIDNLRDTKNWPKAPIMITKDALQQQIKEATEARNKAAEERRESEQMRTAINSLSDGRISVDKTISNKDTLKNIMASVLRMKQFRDGDLFPGYTVISDPEDKKWDRLIRGEFYGGGNLTGTKDRPYEIDLRQTDVPQFNDFIGKTNIESGWWPRTGDKIENPVPTHELSHSSQREAGKKTNYPNLTLDYAERVKRQNFQNTHSSLQELFDKAAENLGYKNLQEAVAGVSGYAQSNAEDEAAGNIKRPANWSPGVRLPEVFAEAFTDVLYNKDKAAPYSKELINLYLNYVNDYEKTFGAKANNNIDSLKQAFWILPPLGDEETFIDKLRSIRILPQK